MKPSGGNVPNVTNIGKQFVTEEDIKKMDNAIIYDPSENDEEFNPANIPEVPQLLNKIIEILEYMCTPEMKTLKTTNYADFEKHMEEKYPAFSTRYYAVFQKLMTGGDLTPLFNMLVALEKVKSGKVSIEDAEKNLGEDLAKRYIKKIDK